MSRRLYAEPHPDTVTPRGVFESRRRLLLGAAASVFSHPGMSVAQTLSGARSNDWSVGEAPTARGHITQYNNFYEFGTSKHDPALYAWKLRTRPWTVSLEGLVQRPRVIDIERILKLAPLEERIYRFRCVEGWSMVVPWVGYPLSVLLKQIEPLGSARYVEFESVFDDKAMSSPLVNPLVFPYIEGLRLDEAMHPLTLLVLGLYGEVLPNQNGAPLRLAVPWKYGFKSSKSIVRIRFTDEQPQTSWRRATPHDVGFYSNVNPQVSTERYDQRRERRLGEWMRRDTVMFNGYAEQVGALYAGMDLRRNF